MANKSDPRTLGGIETFGRRMKELFPERLGFISYKIKRKKYFQVEDIKEIKDLNLLLKIFNKICNNKIRISFLKREIKKIKPEICILNIPREIYALDKNQKKILVQHMNYDFFIPIFCNNNYKLIKKLKEEIDMFVFLSEYDRRNFVDKLNLLEDRTTVIRHTSEIELLKNDKAKNKNLIMVCRIDNSQKRIDLAIKAMQKLRDFTLNIYGDGVDKEFLKNLIKEKNLQNVILHGGTNQVKEKLDENSIFIMTSDFEGYPITTIEAIRRGLPIILRNTFDSAPDIVQNNGILLEKEWNEDKFVEAVHRIYNNYEFYSKNSIEMGKRHNFDEIKSQWKKLFDNLLGTSNAE